VASAPKPFDIIHRGARLWEQEFGLSLVAKQPAGSPEVRKVSSRASEYIKGSLECICALPTAPVARTMRVVPIGPMVSFSRPEAQLDRASNLARALRQWPAYVQLYRMFNPDGGFDDAGL
jgi:hypothetical protein